MLTKQLKTFKIFENIKKLIKVKPHDLKISVTYCSLIKLVNN